MRLLWRMFWAASAELIKRDDPESAAVQLCAMALAPLDPDARTRVIYIVNDRFRLQPLRDVSNRKGMH